MPGRQKLLYNLALLRGSLISLQSPIDTATPAHISHSYPTPSALTLPNQLNLEEKAAKRRKPVGIWQWLFPMGKEKGRLQQDKYTKKSMQREN